MFGLKKMRIAIVYDPIPPWIKGGGGKRYWEFAKRLVKKGHEVHLYTLKRWKGENVIIKEGVYLHGVGKPKKIYTKARVRSITTSIYFSCKLFYPLLKANFDILDCGGTSEFPWFSVKIVALIKRKPLVINWYEVWGDYWYEYLGKFKGLIGKTIEKITTLFPTFIIANAKNTKNDLINLGVDKDKIKVVYDGVDIELIKTVKPSKKKFDLLFVGRLIKDKHVDIVIKSTSIVKKEFNDVTCCIVGKGPEKDNLTKLCEKLDLNKNIEFIEVIESDENLLSVMKASKVFVFPSTREGVPIVLLEANACGVPTIGVKHKLSGVDEVIENGLNGFLLDHLSAELIAEKIILLLKDYQLREKMSKEAIKFVQNFDWNSKTDEIENIYLKLIKIN